MVDGFGVPALDNVAISNNHASWSQISALDVISAVVPEYEDDDSLACDWSMQYDTLEDIQKDLDKVGGFCGNVYAIQVLGDMLGEALDK